MNYGQIIDGLVEAGHRRPRFAPALERSFTRTVEALSNTPRKLGLALPASLLKVFMPYLVFDTVFDNGRVVEEMGYEPVPFAEYAAPLYRFATRNDFAYPYRPWPEERR